MTDEVKSTRETLLHLLLRHKAGLTIDELAAMLSVSRNAVRQHLSSLQRDGLGAVGDVRRNVGRPSQVYTLTPFGMEQFPKQYSLLSGLVLSALKELHGSEGTTTLLKQIADKLTNQYAPRVQGETLAERARTVTEILNELGYEAETDEEGPNSQITAINCVYHNLAPDFPELCALDIELIERLSGSKVEHTECMIKGGESCRFSLSLP
jgi:DeoR family suf operon transcriptional repressor